MDQTGLGVPASDSQRPITAELTQRELFAGWAMQALIREFPGNNCTAIAIHAVEMADALIKELSFSSPNREGGD